MGQPKFDKIILSTKKDNEFLKVQYKKSEVSPKRSAAIWNAEYTKKSDQPLSGALSNMFDMLTPHLLYATELTGMDIKLDKEIDAKKWFKEMRYHSEERFEGLQITEVHFFGKDSIDKIKLKGYRETQHSEKGFKVKLETDWIDFDRAAENHYPLLFILIEQIDDLETSAVAWLEKGETNQVELDIKATSTNSEKELSASDSIKDDEAVF